MSQQAVKAASILTEASRKAAFKGDWKAFLQRHRQSANPLNDDISGELDLAFNQLPDVSASGGLDWSGKARIASLPCGQVCLKPGLLSLSQYASQCTSFQGSAAAIDNGEPARECLLEGFVMFHYQ